MPRPRWSRWGRSSYERDQDLALEAEALRPWVEVLPPDQDAEIVSVVSKMPVDAAFLERAPSARLVVATTSGYDNLDLDLLRARGVVACRLPEARADAVVETALALLLSGLRRVGPLQEAARAGRWARGELPAFGLRSLAGRPVGVVGLGVIGRKMAGVLRALGAEVHGVDPAGLPEGVVPSDVDAMLSTCDVITLHCDLNNTTKYLFSAERLAAVRPGLVLVNTARGALVDVDAAVEALRAGRLAALGLDVFPREPWPDLGAAAELPNLMLTPHAAGWHVDLPARIREGLVRAVRAWVEGRAVPYRL